MNIKQNSNTSLQILSIPGRILTAPFRYLARKREEKQNEPAAEAARIVFGNFLENPRIKKQMENLSDALRDARKDPSSSQDNLKSLLSSDDIKNVLGRAKLIPSASKAGNEVHELLNKRIKGLEHFKGGPVDIQDLASQNFEGGDVFNKVQIRKIEQILQGIIHLSKSGLNATPTLAPAAGIPDPRMLNEPGSLALARHRHAPSDIGSDSSASIYSASSASDYSVASEERIEDNRTVGSAGAVATRGYFNLPRPTAGSGYPIAPQTPAKVPLLLRKPLARPDRGRR